jgi:hypothetical protein
MVLFDMFFFDVQIQSMSAFGGKADMARKYLNIRQRPKMGVRSSSRTTNASDDAYLPCVS